MRSLTDLVANEKFVYKISGKVLRLLQISKEIESIVGLD
jgi:hypothetical protein